MKHFNKFLQGIPALLSSKVSIVIYILLFLYLVVWALLCAVVPALTSYEPSDTVQLIMGNYTNVLSALGASIAAGSGVAARRHYKKAAASHVALQKSVQELQQVLADMKGLDS